MESPTKVTRSAISSEMKRAYLNYAMSVIVMRALPDIRDGLKPVHRRILYAMYKLSLFYRGRFSKSAKVVGEVLGKYHPHGDSPVYDALVRMAQTFSMRYPLVLGQGNFGSIDGDPPAAMRYTEVKLTRIAEELLFDIEKNTVNWQDNFDATLKEPLTLPAKLPNLLLMGAEGIAVGMATKIPPHNLSEIVDGLVEMIDRAKKYRGENQNHTNSSSRLIYTRPGISELLSEEISGEKVKKNQGKKADIMKQIIEFDIDLQDLMKYIKGPDFPTGAAIYGIEDIKQAYATGKGKMLVRAITDLETTKRGRERIVVSELPYQTNKATLIQKIAQLVKDKKISGISDLRDESDREGIRVVIELKRDASYNRLLNNLYKHTDLQTSYPANMVALVGSTPFTVSLRTILEEYLKHRVLIIKKRSIYDLIHAKKRAHILEGLLKALDHIDNIIKIIKKSKSENIARNSLMDKFLFTKIQAQAILDMQLKRLTGLEREKIENELKDLQDKIKGLELLLSDVFNILNTIKLELLDIKKKYGDRRRTKIFKARPGSLKDEELIENKEVIITLTKEGYIKSVPRETFKVQKRGGKGVVGFSTKEEDTVYSITSAMAHDSILFFTNKGKVFQNRVWEIPKGTRTSKGKAVVNLLSLDADEHITSILTYSPSASKEKDKPIFMCTKFGTIKKTRLSQFKNINTRGIIAIRLSKSDELLWVRLTNNKKRVIIATRLGKAIVFNEKDVRPTGRATKGVRGINLKGQDIVTSMDVFEEDEKDLAILVLSEKGIGKKTKIKLFPVQKRGGMGVKIATVDEKTGPIAFSSIVDKTKNTLLITSKRGQVVKIPLKSLPSLSRVAKGVILMRFSSKKDNIVSSTFL